MFSLKGRKVESEVIKAWVGEILDLKCSEKDMLIAVRDEAHDKDRWPTFGKLLERMTPDFEAEAERAEADLKWFIKNAQKPDGYLMDVIKWGSINMYELKHGQKPGYEYKRFREAYVRYARQQNKEQRQQIGNDEQRRIGDA